jgi:hypothetical protein
MISYSASFRSHIAATVPSRQLSPKAAPAAAGTPLARSRSEECREQAAECLEIANRWSDLIKDEYVELARQWQMLAKRAERISQPVTP